MPTASEILDMIAPVYKNHAAKEWFLSRAAARTNRCFFGPSYEEAVALRAAHMLFLAQRAASPGSDAIAGAVVSHSEGELSESFAVSANIRDPELSLSQYGVQLAALIRSRPTVSVTGIGFPRGG